MPEETLEQRFERVRRRRIIRLEEVTAVSDRIDHFMRLGERGAGIVAALQRYARRRAAERMQDEGLLDDYTRADSGWLQHNAIKAESDAQIALDAEREVSIRQGVNDRTAAMQQRAREQAALERAAQARERDDGPRSNNIAQDLERYAREQDALRAIGARTPIAEPGLERAPQTYTFIRTAEQVPGLAIPPGTLLYSTQERVRGYARLDSLEGRNMVSYLQRQESVRVRADPSRSEILEDPWDAPPEHTVLMKLDDVPYSERLVAVLAPSWPSYENYSRWSHRMKDAGFLELEFSSILYIVSMNQLRGLHVQEVIGIQGWNRATRAEWLEVAAACLRPPLRPRTRIEIEDAERPE